MKRILRIVVTVLLVLSVAGVGGWFYYMRRSVPPQARIIPKDAIAVLTLNVRELFLDHSFSGGHLFPEMDNKRLTHKELEKFSRAVEANHGLGLEERADAVAFIYRTGDKAFAGLALAVDDSAKLGTLMRNELPKQVPALLTRMRNLPVVMFDTSSTAISWTKDIALVLYPIGNHSSTETADECTRLLNLSQEQSVMTVADFNDHENESFDIGLWVNVASLRSFTNNAKITDAFLNEVSYLHYAGDFRKGELFVHARHLYANKPPADEHMQLLLPYDPMETLGFLKYTFAQPQNAREWDVLEDTYPVSELPLSTTRLQQLIPLLDGNVSASFHDTVRIKSSYVAYEYDDNFNMIPKELTHEVTVNGTTFCYGLRDSKKAEQVIGAWMKADSISYSQQTGWESPAWKGDRLQIVDNTLIMTNWSNPAPRIRRPPPLLGNLQARLPVGWWLRRSAGSGLSLLFEAQEDPMDLFGMHLQYITMTPPLQKGNERAFDLRLTFQNDKVNALTQLEELLRKAMN